MEWTEKVSYCCETDDCTFGSKASKHYQEKDYAVRFETKLVQRCLQKTSILFVSLNVVKIIS